MITIDQEQMGRGLSNKQVLEFLQSLTVKQLEKPFLTLGEEYGYSFVNFAGPMRETLRVGPDAHALFHKGHPVVGLQENNLDMVSFED